MINLKNKGQRKKNVFISLNWQRIIYYFHQIDNVVWIGWEIYG